MKRLGLTACLIALAMGLSAQAIDSAVPVAIIKFNKLTHIISQKDFRDQVAMIQSSAPGRTLDAPAKLDLLKQMVNTELLKMDLESKGIKATDDDVYNQMRKRNPNLSDLQIRQGVEKQANQPWDVATVEIKKELARQKYLQQFPQFQELSSITVDTKEIQDFYDANSEKFTSPDYIRISHIFFDTKVKPSGTLPEIQKRAEDALKKITSGQATFEELASTGSDDPNASKMNGDLGYIPRSTDVPRGREFIAFFGKDFYDAVFSLKKGEVSKVLTSNVGLHIVRVTQKGDKLDHHFMTLDEPLAPGEQNTVRTYIHQVLLNNKLQVAQQKILTDIANDLRTKAESIKTFEQNL